MKINVIKLIVSILIPLAVGGLGSIVTINQIPTWYAAINKPQLLPPNGIFGPVWTTLFILMGLALYLVWMSKSKNKSRAYLVFGLQLVLNLLWSVLFFGWHALGWAVVEILVLEAVIVANILEFRKVSKTSAWLLLPYPVWVAFATYLTISVWRLN
jgi:tryptophan-rich sensory protein